MLYDIAANVLAILNEKRAFAHDASFNAKRSIIYRN